MQDERKLMTAVSAIKHCKKEAIPLAWLPKRTREAQDMFHAEPRAKLFGEASVTLPR